MKSENKIVNYAMRMLIATSILINVLTGGPSNQTFSARNWGWKKVGKPNIVWVIDILLGAQHCAVSWAYWTVRREKR